MNNDHRGFNTFPRAASALPRQPNELGRISCISIPSTGPGPRLYNTARMLASITTATSGLPELRQRLRGLYWPLQSRGRWLRVFGVVSVDCDVHWRDRDVGLPCRPRRRRWWEGRKEHEEGYRLALHSSFFLGVFNAARTCLGFLRRRRTGGRPSACPRAAAVSKAYYESKSMVTADEVMIISGTSANSGRRTRRRCAVVMRRW